MESESASKCVCGKPGSETCARCKKTTYCSRDCQKADWPTHKLNCQAEPAKSEQKVEAKAEPSKSEAVLSLFDEIKEHVVKNWRLIIMSLFKTQCNNKDEFGSYLVVTVPEGYIPFDKSQPKPAYWTFCLITNCGKFFLLWSDHADGVAKRILSKPLSLRAQAAVGTLVADVPFPPEGVTMDLSNSNRVYAKLDWNTGEVQGTYRIYNGKLLLHK